MAKQTITKSEKNILDENEDLRARLKEAEETLNAIRYGEVDAIVVSHFDSDKIFTLISAETPYRIIVEQMNEGAITLSAKGVIVYCNQRFIELFSIPSEKILGSYFSQLVVEDDKPNFKKLFQKGLKRKSDGEIRCLTGDNHIIYMNLLLSPMPTDMLGDICIMVSDISILKLKEDELSRLNETLEQRVIERTTRLTDTLEELRKSNENLSISKLKAEESDRLKSAFLANMSHEIRTPMNGILGFTELLKKPHLTSERQQTYISMIEKGGARLLNIINDLIDISKIESGQTEVILSKCNIREQIEYICTFFKPEIERKGMQIFIQYSLAEKEIIILTDREKIYAILTNLVKNAIKYCDKGSIEIGYHLTKNSKSPEMMFFVKDTGIGIPQNNLKTIFNRFEQVDRENVRRIEGVGLGLSIAKGYVALLGGKICVESKIGKGSTFYFTIPYNVLPEEKIVGIAVVSAEVTEQQIKKLKILIVEDDESSAMLQTEIVNGLSSEIFYATTGVEVIEIFTKYPDIDLIMMDLSLPLMNGYEATRQIREMNKDVIIIVQTAHVFESDKAKAFEAGCNAFIVKPLNLILLNKLLIKYFSSGS